MRQTCSCPPQFRQRRKTRNRETGIVPYAHEICTWSHRFRTIDGRVASFMKLSVSQSLGNATLIGFLGGVCTGAASFAALFAYGMTHPDVHLGSTAGLAPVMVGAYTTVLGTFLGAILGG